ncbi:MAG: metallophosphoesterase [Defluviitaleaceae bacterium]|nr:metallophosphoesterase [Defluviitaleaceae bacterium]
MSNILVMSDTHGVTSAVKSLLDTFKSQVDAVVHLGDCMRDIHRYALSEADGRLFYMVNGNVDYEENAVEEQVIDIAGKRIFITHGHHYDVKTKLDHIIYRAMELQVNACLFGHTHEPVKFKHEGIFFLNPGSLKYPRLGTDRSYGLLGISENGAINGALMPYKENTWPAE